MARELQLTIRDLKIVPKSRPKFNSKTKTAYYPIGYVTNQIRLRQKIQDTVDFSLYDEKDLKVTIVFEGFYPISDLDNLAGAILDVLVQVRILSNDTTKIVSQLNISYKDSKIYNTTILISL